MDKEKYDMKPIVTVMDSALTKLMDKETFAEKWSYYIPDHRIKTFKIDRDALLQKTKGEERERCAKEIDNHVIITDAEDVALRRILDILRSEIAKAIRNET